jgi:hypothetical protein
MSVNRGIFEIHITVATPTPDEGGVATFQEACHKLSVKAVLIENAGGAMPSQVMTASYVTGTLPDVHRRAFKLSSKFVQMGFTILRVKIESGFSNPGGFASWR